MKIFPAVPVLAALLALCASSPVPAADTASHRIVALDEQTASGYAELVVSEYGPPKGKTASRKALAQVRATLLFERPDRLKVVLHPGEKGERRIVTEAGVLRWLDVSTGLSGKSRTADALDPMVLTLLSTAGGLPDLMTLKDLKTRKDEPAIVRLEPASYGANTSSATAWIAESGIVGLELRRNDGSRTFFAISRVKANVQTSSGDFELK